MGTDDTYMTMNIQEGRRTVKVTSFLMEDRNETIVLLDDGKQLSAYIETVPDEEE